MRNTNAYTEYDYNNFSYYYPISFEKENRCYLQNQYKPSFSWFYGDPIHLEFYIDENSSGIGWQAINDVDSSVLIGYEAEFGTMFYNPKSNIPFMSILNEYSYNRILIEFYNDRFELIYSNITEGDDIVSFDINSTLSKKLFYKGIFYCSIKLLDENGEIIKTLINSPDCILYVK